MPTAILNSTATATATIPANAPLVYGDVVAHVVDVTPAIARRWLDSNTNNRKRSDHQVTRYAADMMADDWVFTGDPIRFHGSGTLIDGQHRLSAIASIDDDGFSVPLLVIEGLGDDAQYAMDQGKKRTTGDQLALSGMSWNTNSMAALAHQMNIIEQGLLFKSADAISQSKDIAWLRNNPDLAEFVGTNIKWFTKAPCTPTTVAVAACVARVAVGEAESDSLLGKFISGAGLSHTSPILHLRNHLLNLRAAKTRLARRDEIGLVLRAFEREFSGDEVTRVSKPKGGSFTSSTFPTTFIDAYFDGRGIARVAIEGDASEDVESDTPDGSTLPLF